MSGCVDEVGLDHWNELEDNYAFVYINPENGSKKVLVKCLVIDNVLVVDALAQGASEPVHLEIEYDSCRSWFVTNSIFIFFISLSLIFYVGGSVGQYVGDDGTANYSGQFKNLDKLVKFLDTEILSKLNGSPKPSR